MGSLPREKAGVGSAVNDTTRQVGGALGVAIIGSIVSSVYASRIADASQAAGLTGTAAAQAESSLGGAEKVAESLGESATGFLDAANQAFVDALSLGLRISAVIVAATAVMVWKFLPARAGSPDGAPAADREPVGAPAVSAGD
jgi:hypothetical protein